MRLKSFLIQVVVAGVVLATPASATTVGNASDDFACCLGGPNLTSNTATYGQVFHGPDPSLGSLLSWTFFSTDASTDGARLVIAQWTGSSVGAELFSSTSSLVSPLATPYANGAPALFYGHTYSGINVDLAASASYIAFWSVIGTIAPAADVTVSASTASPLGGKFVFNNSGPGGVSEDWDSGFPFPNNMHYEATFGAPTPIPPAALLFGSGLGLFHWLARRRRATGAARGV